MPNNIAQDRFGTRKYDQQTSQEWQDGCLACIAAESTFMYDYRKLSYRRHSILNANFMQAPTDLSVRKSERVQYFSVFYLFIDM